MKISLLKEFHEARPFVPFTITLADGQKLPVIHNEFLAFFPSGRGAVLTHADDRLTVIDLLLVTSIHVDPHFRTRPAKPRRKKR